MQLQVHLMCLRAMSSVMSFVMSCALAAGLMYLRLPLDTATAGYNRSAALWISMFAFTLMPSETACSVWNQERAVVRRPLFLAPFCHGDVLSQACSHK